MPGRIYSTIRNAGWGPLYCEYDTSLVKAVDLLLRMRGVMLSALCQKQDALQQAWLFLFFFWNFL